jgi:hypothetical protein
MNKFLQILHFLPLIGPVVQGIEQIHGDTLNGASKKQLAMESLGLAGAAASVALPGFAPEIQVATELASNAIDLVVKGFNLTGWKTDSPVLVPLVTTKAKPTAVATGGK